MSELQNKYRITSRSQSADKILITLQNLDQNTQQQNTLKINHLTTILEVKLSISNNFEHHENIELYFQKDQLFIGNLNEFVLKKIKQANTRIIYYKVVKKRGKSQPQKNNNNNLLLNLVNNIQEQKVQQQLTGIQSKNTISTAQNNPQNLFPYFSNNQGNIVFNKSEDQSLKNTLQKLQIQYNDLEKQNQELANEKRLIHKQILKNSLKIQDLEQENINLSKLNQQLTDELALLKHNQSEFENLKFENQTIKDEINQIRIFSEQILMENNKLQEQISQHVIEKFEFDNLQQENYTLLQIINDYKEKQNLLSQNVIQSKSQLDLKQIKVVKNTFQNLEQQKNSQKNKQIQNITPKLEKNMPSNQDTHNQNLINKCGHTFSIQQLEYIIFKAQLNKYKALCNQCKQPLQQKLCLQSQSLGKIYLENQDISDLLNILNFINLKINSNYKQLAKCKNQNCIFFCIWEQKQIEQKIQQENSFCLICQEQSVTNPFLPDQVRQEMIQKL